MDKIPITSAQGAPPAGPYTPALRWGELLFVSGQVGVDRPPVRRSKVTSAPKCGRC